MTDTGTAVTDAETAVTYAETTVTDTGIQVRRLRRTGTAVTYAKNGGDGHGHPGHAASGARERR